MRNDFVTLTTDFGHESAYVAQMKGRILTIAPDARIVDITHSIPPQKFQYAARTLADVANFFPEQSLHIAVVDPGVGTNRQLLYVQTRRQQFLAPDNGLLDLVLQRDPPLRVIALTNRRYWNETVSNTFHGRDILAPVAAHLLNGLEPDQLGEYRQHWVTLNVPQVLVSDRMVRGEVVEVDSFGNLISNIEEQHLMEAVRANSISVRCAGRTNIPICRTYGDAAPGDVVALIGSAGRLEIAVVNGNAARSLQVEVGEPIAVGW